MNIGIVTLFPDMFTALTDYGISGRAVKQGLVHAQYWNPRDFTQDKHRTVDDRPYGGGPGMLMKTEPVVAAIDAARVELTEGNKKPKVLCLSPQGKRLEHSDVVSLANESSLILLCGRYEGIDERVIQTQVDAEYSIGDYVISGGELAAMVFIDAMIRLQPGALGHKDSAVEDSFAAGLLDYPHYTRPEEYAGLKVPEILLSGDHAAIESWRKQQSLGRTWLRRPDLLETISLDDEQQALLDDFINTVKERS